MGRVAMESLLAFAISNAVLATVLALAACALARWTRNPPLAHFAWLVVLIKLLAPPVLTVPLAGTIAGLPARLGRPAAPPPSPSAGESPEISASRSAGDEDLALAGLSDDRSGDAATIIDLGPEAEPAPAPAIRPAPAEAGGSLLVPTAVLIWLGMGGLFLTMALIRILRFDRLLASARPAPADVLDDARELARRLGLRRTPAVVLVEARIPPLVWTFRGSSRIVLPEGLLPALSAEEVRLLLCHEMAHLRRRDHWLRWIELAALALYWWHPVAWWARRELRKAEEDCCDAWVQHEFSGRTRQYARALLSTVDFLSGARLAVPRTASGLGEAGQLKRRFQMILTSSRRHRLSTPLRAAAIAAGALLLSWSPITSGQSPDHGDPAGSPPPTDAPAAIEPRAAPATETPVDQKILLGGELSGNVDPAGDVVLRLTGGGGTDPDKTSADDSGKGRDGGMERRLEKLEAQLKGLMDEVKKMRSAAGSGKEDPFDSFFGDGADSPKVVRRGRLSLGQSGDRNYVLRSGDSSIFFKKREKENGVVIAKESESGKVLWESRVDVSENPEITVSEGQLTIRDRSTGKTTVLDMKSGKQLSRSEGDPRFQYWNRSRKGDAPSAGARLYKEDWARKEPKGSERSAVDERARLEDMLKKLDAQQEDFLAKMKAERARLIEDLKKLEDQGKKE